MATKKLLDKNNPENTVVRVIFRGKFNDKYDCVGVLVREEKKMIRIAFSAKDNKMVDFLDVRKSKIVSIGIIHPSAIKNL